MGILDVSHALTFCEAALDLSDITGPQQTAQLAILAASFVAHAIKGLEALERLERLDPEADSVYLQAFGRLAVHRWPERAPQRTARIAQ